MTTKFGETLKRLVEDKDATKRKTNAEKKLDKQFKKHKKLKLNRLNKIVNQNKYILSDFDIDKNLIKETELKKIATKGVISLFNSIYEAQSVQKFQEIDVEEEEDVEIEQSDNERKSRQIEDKKDNDHKESKSTKQKQKKPRTEDNDESDGVMDEKEFFRLLNED